MAKRESLHIVRQIENVTEYESLSDVAKTRVDKLILVLVDMRILLFITMKSKRNIL